MFKRIVCLFMVCFMVVAVSGCSSAPKEAKIGVSLGVGKAERWKKEKVFMEDRAKELNATIDVKLNTSDDTSEQVKDCKELIDSGIQVLILTVKTAETTKEILDYAKEKNVKVIAYSRVIMDHKVDLYVGYDSLKIGQFMGQHLTETVDKGTYIVLKGDKEDFNTPLLYNGAMKYIDPIKSQINIILEEYVTGWSPDVAKELVKQALSKNNNKVDAILAPNDKLAGACREVLSELGIKNKVVISGMDAELDAIKRIIADKQDMTVHLDLQALAHAAVDSANDMALGKEVKSNSKFDNKTEDGIDAYLISGQVVTKQNIDTQIIDKKIYTKEDVYN